jgi:transcriptional regulator with XRE-family HTH domain
MKGILVAIERSKSVPRSFSRYSREAVAVLGQLIRIRRIERKLGIEELATRAGVSRDMMRRIEQGDPRCGIGMVFEAATIVGVPLFESDRSRLTTLLVEQEDKLRLLPKAIHKPRTDVKDDF